MCKSINQEFWVGMTEMKAPRPIGEKPEGMSVIKDVYCGDNSSCPDGTTCCQQLDGHFTCCQFKNVRMFFMPLQRCYEVLLQLINSHVTLCCVVLRYRLLIPMFVFFIVITFCINILCHLTNWLLLASPIFFSFSGCLLQRSQTLLSSGLQVRPSKPKLHHWFSRRWGQGRDALGFPCPHHGQ